MKIGWRRPVTSALMPCGFISILLPIKMGTKKLYPLRQSPKKLVYPVPHTTTNFTSWWTRGIWFQRVLERMSSLKLHSLINWIDLALWFSFLFPFPFLFLLLLIYCGLSINFPIIYFYILWQYAKAGKRIGNRERKQNHLSIRTAATTKSFLNKGEKQHEIVGRQNI